MPYLFVLIAEADPDAIDLDVTGAGDYGINRDDEDDEPAPKKASRYESTICNSMSHLFSNSPPTAIPLSAFELSQH